MKTSISFTLGKQVINKYLEDILLDIQSQETSFSKLKLMYIVGIMMTLFMM